MLKLKNYSFSGIGRFAQKQHIDLETRDHLIQIDGENTNTGGSSGAGKSTTVEALAYLLGISEIPSTQLQSRLTKSPIWVQGEFEGEIIITRSKKDGLTIQTPSGTVSGNSKLAEEKLDEIIGVNRKLLKTMCYKRQKQGGFFLNLTPKESHEFLVDCLNLTELKDKRQKLEITLKDKYKPRHLELNAQIETLKSGLEGFDSILQMKTKPVEPVLEDVSSKSLEIDLLKQALENETKTYNEMIQNLGPKPVEPEVPKFEKEDEILKLQTVISELKSTIQQNIKNKNESIEQAQSAVNKIQNKIQDSNNTKTQMIRVKQDIDKLTENLEHLETGKCPTCIREWDTDEGRQNLADMQQLIESKRSEFSELRNVMEKVPHYRMMEEKAQAILEKNRNVVINVLEEEALNTEQTTLSGLLNEKQNMALVARKEYLELSGKYNDQFTMIDNEFKNKKLKLNDKIAEVNYAIEKVELQKKSYKESLETYENDLININKEKTKTLNELSNKQDEFTQTEMNIILSEESIRLIRDYTLQKFQDTLEYIGQRATEIINMIPNMSNAVIYFESAKETKTGKVKNEVNAVINLEGDSGIPIKTLSGGERTSADFAIDLAVGEMIESMTQKGVNFLIIDEGFDGLDSVSKIECLEILKSLNTNKKIMMVDHSQEVKEMVGDIIKVRRINEESFVL